MRTMYVLRTDDRPTSHFGKFRTAIPRQRIIRSTSCLFLGRVFEVGGSNGATSDWTKIQDYGRQPSCIILNGHISDTVHPVLFVFGSRVKVQEKIMREE